MQKLCLIDLISTALNKDIVRNLNINFLSDLINFCDVINIMNIENVTP